MRIHRLEIEAMGPFADPVVLDLDEVSAEGLFLIQGPTGAGKTSIIDAICFGLFSGVPGARGRSSLVSDHAVAGALPRVLVELTAGGRRLRITRSPAHERAKKRGTGTTPVQATVCLEELVGSEWVVRSTRHDEAGEVIHDVIGMGLEQFAKVVVLPQGDFAAFLRASADERSTLLQRLFDIETFTGVETWLTEERRRTQRAAEEAATALAAQIARVQDAIGLSAEDTGPDLDGLAPAQVPGMLADLLAWSDGQVTATMAAFDQAQLDERVTSEGLRQVEALAAAQSRGHAALRALEDLQERAETQSAHEQALDLAQRAKAVRGHREALTRTRSARDSAAAQLARALTSLDPVASSEADAAEALRLLTERDTAARRWESARVDAATSAGQVSALTDEVAGTLQRHVGAQARVGECRAALDRSDQDLRAHETVAASLDAARAELAEAERLARLVAGRDEDRATLTDTAAALLDARERAAAVRSELLDLRERRLEEMAGALAATLSDGDPCPVCGSAEHPSPAAGESTPVTAEQVEQADAAHEQARSLVTEREVAHAALSARVAAANEQLTGVDVVALADRRRRAAEACRQATEAQDACTVLRSALEVGRRALESAAHAEVQQAAALAEHRGALKTAEQAAHAASARLSRAVDAHAGCPCLTMTTADQWTIAAHDSLRQRLQVVTQAVQHRDQARVAEQDAREALREALAAQELPDEETARSADLSEDELRQRERQVRAHADAEVRARSTLAETDVAAALATAPADLATAQEAAADARSRLLLATRAQSAAERRHAALVQLAPAVDQAAAAEQDALARSAAVRGLADTLTGAGPDNTLRMRLTAYVLAARLEQVVDLANQRLSTMGAGRYLLEHTDERSGRGRSGLGLRVLDQWTGRPRATASLSGGESFMASLALALGLADAVRAEAGGRDLGMLFVDEGFGSLDDESLDDVMGILDGLREGGRAVGVVSHVADLRTRITHQIVVTKGTRGSHAALCTTGSPAA